MLRVIRKSSGQPHRLICLRQALRVAQVMTGDQRRPPLAKWQSE